MTSARKVQGRSSFPSEKGKQMKVLGKYAFKPIANALKAREQKIEDALAEAQKAREEMKSLTADNEKLLNEAREERAKIIKEAKEIKDSIVADAKDKAKTEASKVLADAKSEIHNQKMAAITDVKNQIGSYSIELAKQILGRELKNSSEQEAFVAQEVKKITLS